MLTWSCILRKDGSGEGRARKYVKGRREGKRGRKSCVLKEKRDILRFYTEKDN